MKESREEGYEAIFILKKKILRMKLVYNLKHKIIHAQFK
jgi:hypothetical protein